MITSKKNHSSGVPIVPIVSPSKKNSLIDRKGAENTQGLMNVRTSIPLARAHSFKENTLISVNVTTNMSHEIIKLAFPAKTILEKNPLNILSSFES